MEKVYGPGMEFNTNMSQTVNLASCYIPTILYNSFGAHAGIISTATWLILKKIGHWDTHRMNNWQHVYKPGFIQRSVTSKKRLLATYPSTWANAWWFRHK